MPTQNVFGGTPTMFMQQDPALARRYQMAQLLQQQGADTSPVQHPLQALARVLQGGVGGYLSGKVESDAKDRQQAATDTMAQALRAGQPWKAPDNITGPNGNVVVPQGQDAPGTGGQAAMVAALMGNKDTAPLGMQMQMQQIGKEQDFQNAMRLAKAKAEMSKVTPLSAEEVKSLGLPPGTVAQRDASGKINVVSKSDLLSPEALEQKKQIAAQGRDQNMVNLPPLEKEESKEVGKYFGEVFVNTQKAAVDSRQRAAKLDRIDQLLENVQTGKFAGTALEIKKAAQALGINLDLPENIGAAEAANALANEISLSLRNPAGGAGMPGAMSDKDREFLVGMVPGIGQTAQGRKMMIETAKRIAKRDQDVARMARDYRRKNGKLDEGFFDDLQAFSEANPLFEGLGAKQPAGAGNPQIDDLLKKYGGQ